MMADKKMTLHNENIICFSSIDWDFNWQGHQEIMSRLAENGNRVLFIENTGVRTPNIKDLPRLKSRIKNWFSGVKGIHSESDNIFIYSPILLPFPYLRIVRAINRHIMLSVLEKWIKLMNFNNAVIWTFLPTPLSLEVIDFLTKKIIIYHCVDKFSESHKGLKKISFYENKLLKKADLVFVTSRSLYEYCSQYNSNVAIFHSGVDFEKFRYIASDNQNQMDEIKGLRRPIIGYVGGINSRLDYELIEHTALELKDYSFVFIGPVETDVSRISRLKNVRLLGKKSHADTIRAIRAFNVCIMPYRVNEFTRNIYPAKLNEYHAMGKPVVSTALPEILEFNRQESDLVKIAAGPEQFIGGIMAAAVENSESSICGRIASAKKNDWGGKVEKMSGLIVSALQKKSSLGFDWRGNFLKLYRRAKIKTFKVTAVVLCAYLVVFYTPLFWYIAVPLEINDKPTASDAIVVFAGGVGETGQANQGYEERVNYADQLYKKKLADKIIFSSGYTYVFKEPEVMKALAVSLGIPEANIILEEKAASAYQNVIFTKKILEARGWNKIILVSSPYNMRRVKLLFEKNYGSIRVDYAPAPKSRFFSAQESKQGFLGIYKKISLRQIKAILHEYAAIGYYYLKGYI
jgi:uncharacterized SAM-binding protein YcdF (DUF218 family)